MVRELSRCGCVLLVATLASGCATSVLLYNANERPLYSTQFHHYEEAYVTPHGEMMVLVRGKTYKSTEMGNYTLRVPIEEIKQSKKQEYEEQTYPNGRMGYAESHWLPPSVIEKGWIEASPETDRVDIPVVTVRTGNVLSDVYREELRPIGDSERTLYGHAVHPSNATSFMYVEKHPIGSRRHFIVFGLAPKKGPRKLHYYLALPLTVVVDVVTFPVQLYVAAQVNEVDW